MMTLSISAVAPARRTRALPGEPDATSVASNPRASASTPTKTATVPALPSTAIPADRQRAGEARHDRGWGEIEEGQQSTGWITEPRAQLGQRQPEAAADQGHDGA